jgi:hypothetical protein
MQPSSNQPQSQFPQSSNQTPGNPFDSAQAQAGMIDQQLKQAYEAAGSTFYSIALFSLINSVISYFQGGIYFPIGLGITQIIDSFSYAFQQEIPEASTVFSIFGILLNLAILGVVALFGYFIKKQKRWLISIGGILYLLDGLLILLFQDWIGGAFHAYFLFRLWTSWQAINKLSKMDTPQSAIGSL